MALWRLGLLGGALSITARVYQIERDVHVPENCDPEFYEWARKVPKFAARRGPRAAT